MEIQQFSLIRTERASAQNFFSPTAKRTGVRKAWRNSMTTTIMRYLRQKHGVSLAELARCAGVSPQYMSSIELGEYPATDNAKHLAISAFERFIERRRECASQLAEDFAALRERLLDPADMERERALPRGVTLSNETPTQHPNKHICSNETVCNEL
jgi:transcriptional regulator with XRE-family HTH domain